MGIGKLNEFLKKEVPNSFRRIDVNIFKNTRIAIDFNIISYKFFSKAYSTLIFNELQTKEEYQTDFFIRNDYENYKKVLTDVCNKFINFIDFFVKHDILPIFVIDGVCIKEKEDYAHIRRGNVSKNIKEKMVKEENFEIFKKKAVSFPPVNRMKDFNDFSVMKVFIKNVLKIPFIMAPNEAEKMCSWLCRTKFTSAVFSTDTDCLAFGAPLMITEIDYVNKKFLITQLPVVLKGLNITQSQFVDLCILLGCDFNNKVMNLGYSKIWHKIIFHNLLDNEDKILIDEIEKVFDNKDFNCIKKERCREIFSNFDDCEKHFEKINYKIFKRYKIKENFFFKEIFLKKKKEYNIEKENYRNVEVYEKDSE